MQGAREGAVPPAARSFSSNRELASEAGRKGGQASQTERRRRLNELLEVKRGSEAGGYRPCLRAKLLRVPFE